MPLMSLHVGAHTYGCSYLATSRRSGSRVGLSVGEQRPLYLFPSLPRPNSRRLARGVRAALAACCAALAACSRVVCCDEDELALLFVH